MSTTGKLVEVERDRIIVKPICWHIKPLRDIIDFFPEMYDKVIHFLHCMVSLNPHDNPFSDVAEEEKEEKILRYLNIDVDTDNDIIKDGLDCVLDSYGTSTFRSYESLKKLQDGINSDLRDMKLTYDKESGNVGNVMAVVKTLSVVKKEIKDAKRDYLEEFGELRGKGGIDFSYDEFDDDDMDEDD